MKIVNTGNTFSIYDDSLKTSDTLPAGTYSVCFSKMSGFYLEAHVDMQVNEKTYGTHLSKVEKVMSSFAAFHRSLGVILSGAKGIGKSMFARLLSINAITAGMPVLIVDSYIPGIANFIDSIDQQVMVLFDEFDKTFARIKSGDDAVMDAQASLLSLFDGVSNGKKLFVVTCNDLNNLNDFLVNRPGRFHYHFRFSYPTPDEIRTYLSDKLAPEYHGQIEAVVSFGSKVDLNYDCLRAISFELNRGETFQSTIEDLNIVNVQKEYYNLALHMDNGKILTKKDVRIDMFNPEETKDEWMKYGSEPYMVSVSASVSAIQYNKDTQSLIIPGEALSIDLDEDYNDPKDKPNFKLYNEYKNAKPLYFTITRQMPKNIHYAV